MSIVTIPGIKYPVDVVTIAQLKAIGDDVAKASLINLSLAGGAMAVQITQEYLDAIKASSLSGFWKTEASILKPGPVICVLHDAVKNLSEEAKYALLLHEEAHILHGDLTAENANTDVNGMKLAVHHEFELRADAYAASRTSKAAMKEALQNALSVIVKINAKMQGIEESAVKIDEKSSQEIQQRLQALSD